jgi:hypothetical protein
MGLYLSLIAGLTFWIVAWASLGMKSLDAFLVTILIVLVAASGRLLSVFLPGRIRGED